MPDKWRVAHDIVTLSARQELIPVVAQGVGAHDITLIVQWQMRYRLPCNGLGIIKHLLLGDPQRGLRYSYGEIIDLDAIKLVDTLTRLFLAAQLQISLVVQHIA